MFAFSAYKKNDDKIASTLFIMSKII